MVMKKILAVLLCGSLMMFAGCSAEQSSSSEPETEQSSSSQAEESSSQEEESSSAAEGEIDPAVQEMMDALAAYQPVTAGSSLKVYIAACGVLNYAEEYDSSMEDTLRSSVEAWMAQADETTLECLREGREAVGRSSPKVRRARRCWQMPAIPTSMKPTIRKSMTKSYWCCMSCWMGIPTTESSSL